MIENNKKVKVTNRDSGTVGFLIPDGKYEIHETFQRGETKEIEFGILQKLVYQPGGRALLRNYLRIDDKAALAELLGSVEPEYHYTEADVERLLLKGSLDELKDCLDFAPTGVIEIIKDLAVKLKINDIAKREAILEQTDFDVTKAIEIEKITKEASETKEEEKPKRRVSQEKETNAEAKPTRRTVAPKYEVVGE